MRGCVVALTVVINLVVLYNAIRHDPRVGYDATAHIDYARTLATGRLPGPDETHEFFSAPLPYVIPAVVGALGGGATSVGKTFQVVNVFCGIALCLLLAELARQAVPGRRGEWAAVVAVGLLGSLPVFYKSFAMARGEPMLAALSAWAMLLAVRLSRRPNAPIRRWLTFGVVLGLIMLARQWGAFVVLPAAGLVTAFGLARLGTGALPKLIAAALLSLLVAAPFYASLAARFGTIAAFNREGRETTMADYQALFRTDWPLDTMLHEPAQHQMFGWVGPVFYADFWGDYWLQWAVFALNEDGRVRQGRCVRPDAWAECRIVASNYHAMMPYLGRVNAVAILPTLLAIVAVGWGAFTTVRRIARREGPARLLCLGVIATTAVGYGWFVVTHRDITSDVVKGTYVLHAVPAVCLLMAAAISDLHRRWPALAWTLIVLLALIAVHNARLFVTAYT